MHPVAVFDLISFLASFAALAVMLRGWKRALRNETKILLAGILIFTAFYGLCLFLEWVGITKALDKIEDLIGALIPMWWAFIFYSFLKEISEKDLRQSEAKFQDLYDNAPDMFVSVDAKTARIIECNRTLLRATGYEKEEVIGQSIFFIYHPDSLEGAQKAFRMFATSGIVKDKELQLCGKDGSKIDVSLNVSAVRDEAGNILYSRSIWRDITERRKMEEEIKTANDRLKYLLRSTSAVIYTSKVSGDYGATSITENVKEIWGHEPKEFTENSNFWIDHVHPGDRAYVLEEVSKIHEKGKHAYEYRFLHKNGSYMWVRDEITLIKDGSGNPVEIVGYWIDITERKKAEEALLASEKNYRALFEGAPDGIIIADTETGKYIHVNPSICEKLGYTEKEIKDLSQFRGIHPEAETDRVKDLFYRQARGEINIAEDIPFVKKDGMLLYFDVVSVHVEFDGVRRVVGLLRDITERKKLEEMKDNLIRDVSHSLKTPIVMSSMAIDVIKKGIEKEDLMTVNTGHSIANNNVKRALKNVNNILDISFFDRKGKVKVKQEVSLIDTINSNLRAFGESIKNKGLEVELGIPEDAGTVFFIPSDLMTLFDNLIENAVKFTQKGNVSITGESKDGIVEVKIKDTGRGMDAEETKKVFEKFYKKRASEPGIGLGLSICKEIMERNEAKIEVASEGVGKGTTVTLHLPRAPRQGG